jgi:hypothetical protein
MFVGGPISRQIVRLRSPQESRPTKTNLRIATGEIEDLRFEIEWLGFEICD